MNHSLQLLNEQHIEQLIQLSQSVDWDYDRFEIETILSVGKVYGYIHESRKVIASAAIIPYAGELASIGMVIVHPNYRGLQLGKRVMEACIQSVGDDKQIMLITTPDGKPMYEKLGFQVVSSVHKYLCDEFICERITFHEYEITNYEEKDFLHVRKLDEEANGVDRSEFLKVRIKQAKQTVVVKNRSGTIVGFGLSIQTPANLILGPIVAFCEEVAVLIIYELSHRHNGRLRIDTPENKVELTSFLQKKGFYKVAQPPIMVRNGSTLLQRNENLYGIAAQIFG
ncbi:GNAT family N-acetyltransferase [Bacillus manliponensis]|uniref:GNAT family N-acetyltransferase n=1 Tax=Bacillus manliponensis TaxID=574376 RepID=UPI00068D1926|nr:GNAT family N-acetyltransferase [Bacillus manliponensis]